MGGLALFPYALALFGWSDRFAEPGGGFWGLPPVEFFIIIILLQLEWW